MAAQRMMAPVRGHAGDGRPAEHRDSRRRRARGSRIEVSRLRRHSDQEAVREEEQRALLRQATWRAPPTEDIQASGAYRFRASGVYAADTTEISQEPQGTGRSREISIGREFCSQAYVRSNDGKYIWKSPSTVGRWSYGRNLAGVVWGEDLINGINPGFLKLRLSWYDQRRRRNVRGSENNPPQRHGDGSRAG